MTTYARRWIAFKDGSDVYTIIRFLANSCESWNHMKIAYKPDMIENISMNKPPIRNFKLWVLDIVFCQETAKFVTFSVSFI